MSYPFPIKFLGGKCDGTFSKKDRDFDGWPQPLISGDSGCIEHLYCARCDGREGAILCDRKEE